MGGHRQTGPSTTAAHFGLIRPSAYKGELRSSGEEISSRIFADLINQEFDALIPVDPAFRMVRSRRLPTP